MDQQNFISDQNASEGITSAPPYPYPDQTLPNAPPLSNTTILVEPEYKATEGKNIPPPNPWTPYPELPTPRIPDYFVQSLSISEDVARKVFIEYASKKCCYSTNPAKKMVFTSLQPFSTYRYRLETFAESRSTAWADEPYIGQTLDLNIGVPPTPWNIEASPSCIFKEELKEFRIPYTSSRKECFSCEGHGKFNCRQCYTLGRVVCFACSGLGRFGNSMCYTCGGCGRVCCMSCSGLGMITCDECDGNRFLHNFLKLTVYWQNNVDESIVDKESGLSVRCINMVNGENVFSEHHPVVYPVVGFPEDAINQASARAVTEHQTKFFNNCRILQQRQTIELIPVTRVQYSWNHKDYLYFVYGTENRVFTEDYPEKCCCCPLL